MEELLSKMLHFDFQAKPFKFGSHQLQEKGDNFFATVKALMGFLIQKFYGFWVVVLVG